METVEIVALVATGIIIYVVAFETRFDKHRSRYEEEMAKAQRDIWRLHMTVDSLLDGDPDMARSFFRPTPDAAGVDEDDDDSFDRYS